jgi:hypothetical protein
MTTTTTIPSGQISEFVRHFLRLRFLGFGGPVALVAQMERELVDERKWLTKEQMREAIAICQRLCGGNRKDTGSVHLAGAHRHRRLAHRLDRPGLVSGTVLLESPLLIAALWV